MACCLCAAFSQGSRTWLAAALLLVIPVFAVSFTRSISPSILLLSIPLSLLLILFSTLFIIKNKQQQQHKPKMLQEITKTTPTTTISPSQPQELYSENEGLDQCSSSTISSEDEGHFSDVEFSSQDKPQPDAENTETALIEVPSSIKSKPDKLGQKNEGFSIGSRDSFSESESLDHCSTTSSEEDHYHSSDIEWPYSMGQRLDCSDDSISDEESLIEIAIPSGQFVYPSEKKKKKDYDYDPKLNLKRCKLSADMNEMNEEDNLIEIDIYMGSIKCSRF